MELSTIPEIVRKMEQDYTTGTTTISKYVQFSLYETLQKIDAYLNSKHINGRIDSLGRIKPFFNIVIAAVNIWFRATDLDTKNVKLKAKNSKQAIQALLGNILLSDFMKKESFGSFLNKWGRTLAKYCSAVCKFVEKSDGLHCEVIPWNKLIVDSIDFYNNPVIEILYYTPAQLRRHSEYNQDLVEQLINSHGFRETLDGQNKDNKSEYIKVYEIHGNFPVKYLKKSKGEKISKNDEKVFTQQIHIISFVSRKNEKGEDYWDDYTLYSGREKNLYLLTHLLEEDDRILGIGPVEGLFEAQFMVNHTAKEIKDQLDLASRLIFQTADANFVGMNVLKNLESGDILRHALNQPLTKINNDATDVTSLRMYQTDWINLSKDISSTPDAQRGNTFPSGTAYRQVALLAQQSNSLFEVMTENKGLYLEQMLRQFIIPYLKKKMDTSEEISALLTDEQVTQVDAMYVPAEAVRRANKKIVQKVLNEEFDNIGQDQYETDIANKQQSIQNDLNKLGNQRFFKPSEISSKTWKDVLKDFEWTVEVEITNENNDKQVVYETLFNLLQTVANPNTATVLQTPTGKMLFNKILNETGKVSPIEFTANLPQAPLMPQTQQPAIQMSQQTNMPAMAQMNG